MTIISGRIGAAVRVTGDNFFAVTRVDLLSESCRFEILNENLMNVVIPNGGTSDFPTFYSDYSETYYTGADKIVVFPKIIALNNYTGMYQDTINVTGYYFSGATGVRLNNIECPFSVLSNTQIDLTVPSGNVRGPVKVQVEAGIESISDFNFYPEVTVTGSEIGSAGTGENITLLGKYFFTELLFNIGGKYLVSFNGNRATGLFDLIDPFTLQGNIPTAAISGSILIAKSPALSGLIEYYSS